MARKNVEKVIAAFQRGEAVKGDAKGTISTDGTTIFSYALPIFRRNEDGALEMLVSLEGQSATTRSQIRAIEQFFRTELQRQAQRQGDPKRSLFLAKVRGFKKLLDEFANRIGALQTRAAKKRQDPQATIDEEDRREAWEIGRELSLLADALWDFLEENGLIFGGEEISDSVMSYLRAAVNYLTFKYINQYTLSDAGRALGEAAQMLARGNLDAGSNNEMRWRAANKERLERFVPQAELRDAYVPRSARELSSDQERDIRVRALGSNDADRDDLAADVLADALMDQGWQPPPPIAGDREWVRTAAIAKGVFPSAAMPAGIRHNSTQFLRLMKLIEPVDGGARIACACARSVLHLVPSGEDRPRKAIEAAERWIADPSAANSAVAAAAAEAAYTAYAARTPAEGAASAYAAYAAHAAYAANSLAYALNDSVASAVNAAANDADNVARIAIREACRIKLGMPYTPLMTTPTKEARERPRRGHGQAREQHAARDYDSKASAIAAAQWKLGATHYAERGQEILLFVPIYKAWSAGPPGTERLVDQGGGVMRLLPQWDENDPPKTMLYRTAALKHARGLWHLPAEPAKHARPLPPDAKPIAPARFPEEDEEIVTTGLVPVSRGPSTPSMTPTPRGRRGAEEHNPPDTSFLAAKKRLEAELIKRGWRRVKRYYVDNSEVLQPPESSRQDAIRIEPTLRNALVYYRESAPYGGVNTVRLPLLSNNTPDIRKLDVDELLAMIQEAYAHWYRERLLSEGAEVKENPLSHEELKEAIPWMKVERDAEAYKDVLARAKQAGPITGAQSVYDLLHATLAKEDQEVFVVVCLDTRGQLRGVVEVHRGGRSRVAVAVPDVLRVAVASGCEAFVIVHNHPSGKADPSDADKELTTAVEEGAKATEVACVDHVIIGIGEYYSFVDKKLTRLARARG